MARLYLILTPGPFNPPPCPPFAKGENLSAAAPRAVAQWHSTRSRPGGHLAEDVADHGGPFVHLAGRDVEGREQADDGVVRAVDQQPALHALGDRGRARDRQVDSDHHPADAQFTDDLELA